jgi:hypothetical protein
MSWYYSFGNIVTPDVFDGFRHFVKSGGSDKTVSFSNVSTEHINEALSLIEDKQNYSLEISSSTIDGVMLGDYKNVKFDCCVMKSLKYPITTEFIVPNNITLEYCEIGMVCDSWLSLSVFAEYDILFKGCYFGGFSEIDEERDLTYRNWVCVKAEKVNFTDTQHVPEQDLEISVCATESFECSPTALLGHMKLSSK